ncbi:MAG: LCP family protein [Eubacterium sp.]|nr:LCP family protein [Eubacterium sp.]
MGRDTKDYGHQHFSPELIRQLEDPEYAKAAEAYEREARRRRAAASRNADADVSVSQSAGQGGYGSQSYANQGGYGSNQYYGSQNANGQQYTREQRNRSYGRKKSRKQPQRARRVDQMAYGGAGASGGNGGGRPVKKKKKHVIRNIFLILIVLIIALMAYLMSLTANLDRVDTSGEDFAISSEAARGLVGYRNILILGSDARADESLDGSRTDAIIILSINRMNSDVRMISVMRDSYLKFRLSDGELGLDKLTHAHAFGGGVNAVEGLNRCLDLNIKEFVVFDWKAVADTVDTLGGIEVNVKKNEVGDLNTWGPETAENVGKSWTRVRHTGMQTLDGPQAVTYCRIRKNSGGDTSRGSRYKTVMAAVMKKAASNPMKLNALSEEVMPQVRTNMSQTQLATLIMRAPFMDSEKSIAWPKKYYGGIVGEVWYAVPQTLNTNVRRLHRKAFGQKNYTPSETCRSINDEIINVTGIQ